MIGLKFHYSSAFENERNFSYPECIGTHGIQLLAGQTD